MAQYPLTDFLAGEISDTLGARFDLPAYKRGCKTLKNAFVLPTGAVQKRPGTYWVGTGKTAGKRVRLVPFLVSQTEGIVCEFGENYIRFFRDSGPILDTGVPYEKVTTYSEAELRKLRHAQVSSVLRIVHQEHKPAKLTRTTDISWTLADISFTVGAGEEDFSAANHYPGCIEVYEDRLIHANTETNPDTFWGSTVSLYDKFMQRRSATVTITIASPAVVTWTAHGLLESQSVVFSTTGALPTGLTPGVVYYVVGASITTDTFQVSATPGGAAINTSGAQSGVHTCYCNLPLASDAWQKTPHAKKHNQILWLLAENTLLFGTSTGLWRVGGPEQFLTPNTAWWPKRQSDVGCADVEALLVDDVAVFVEKCGERVHMATYAQDADKYQTTDLTFFADHICRGGIVELAYQRSPSPMLWAVRADGVLLSMGLSRQEQIVGWSRHELGGEVESVCVIPTSTEDQVWVAVKRTVGGVAVRHIEYFKPRAWTALTDYFYVDSGKSFDYSATQDSITGAASYPLMDHGDCENADVPHVQNDGKNLSGCTFDQSTERVYQGTHSRKLVKTAAVGVWGMVEFVDNALTTDLHGFVPGRKYKLAMRANVPSAGGPSSLSEAVLRFAYYNAGAWTFFNTSPTAYDQFQEISVEMTIPLTATGTWSSFGLNTDASTGECVYADEIKIRSPVMITANAHPFLDDDFLRISGVVGMTQLNGNVYMVKNKTANTLELYLIDGVTFCDGVDYSAYVSGGLCEKVIKTVTGLSHLEGKTVVGIGDGATVQGGVVSGGSVTMGSWARVMHVGLAYYPILEPRNLALALARYKRVTEVFILFYNTVGALVGPSSDNLRTVVFRPAGFLMGEPINPATGGYSMGIQGPWKKEVSLYITQADPLPWTVLGLVAEVEAA